MLDTPPCSMVIFGASGDLTRRKLIPSLYRLFRDRLLPDAFAMFGYGRSDMTDEAFRERLRPEDTDGAWEAFARRLFYVQGGYDEAEGYRRLLARIQDAPTGCGKQVVFYTALPPAVTETLLGTLGSVWQAEAGAVLGAARILIEKPFGVDLESAARLNRLLLERFPERQIYRIDHYLAKDTVRNLLVFRFANAIFEPLWNRHYIDHIQISATEALGVEERGGYYDTSGVVRDMLQNHVLQVMALVAMEPPAGRDEESVRDRKSEVFRAVAAPGAEDFVLAQYNGYRAEKGVPETSTTPTFAAVRLRVENWRWQGVPFYLRSGKALAEKCTEIAIRFRTVPLCLLGSDAACARVMPNTLYIRIQPEEGIRLCFNAQTPGRTDAVGQAEMNFRYAELGAVTAESYERVIVDAMASRPGLFWRADGIEAAWRVVTPLLTAQAEGRLDGMYERGSRGPACADELLGRSGHAWLPDTVSR